MPAFKRKPATIKTGGIFGMGKVSLKGKKLIVTPMKRKGVNVGKKKVLK